MVKENDDDDFKLTGTSIDKGGVGCGNDSNEIVDINGEVRDDILPSSQIVDVVLEQAEERNFRACVFLSSATSTYFNRFQPASTYFH